MKRITGITLMLCALLMAGGCGADTDKTDESTSAAVSQADSSSTKSEETQATEVTVQSEQTGESTQEEAATEAVSTENSILKLNQKELYDYEWSDEYGISLVETEYSTILLDDEDAERYPELAAVLKEFSDLQEGYMNEEYDMLKELAETHISEDESFSPLKSTYDRQVRRADGKVLSILVDSYYYNGEFDSRSLWGENYDTETGEDLLFSDVVTDIDGFAQAVENQLFNSVGEDVFSNNNIIKEYFEMYGADGTHWTLDYNGVTVYFSEGELAGAGLGAVNVTVTFAEHPELFNAEYMDVPESYIVALPMTSTFYTDFDGDGSCEELTLTDSYDTENQFYATLDIYTADVSYTESFWAYGCEPYYVKTADGRNYLYFFTELETQMYLYVYDISSMMISKVGEANVTPFYNDGLSAVLTNPDSMHFDIFSDEAGGGVPESNDFFSVGSDGMPVQD